MVSRFFSVLYWNYQRICCKFLKHLIGPREIYSTRENTAKFLKDRIEKY